MAADNQKADKAYHRCTIPEQGRVLLPEHAGDRSFSECSAELGFSSNQPVKVDFFKTTSEILHDRRKNKTIRSKQGIQAGLS
jgi:hypothetical protein